ncbi:MAG TPA: hypothetical protein VEL51_18130 [Vicinamibacterales bacterium]|nr:hypothetical protein [Vicinamibacterales bacterium]
MAIKWAGVLAAALVSAAPVAPPEVLRSTGGLPAHIAGSFQKPIGFQQADNGQYFVFDRRAHGVYTVTGDSVKKIIEVGAEAGRVLDPSAFDIDPSDGSFVIADAPFGDARIQTFTASGGRIGGFSLSGKQVPRLTLESFVLNGVGSIQYTGKTILINQPELGSLITELAFDGTPSRTIGELRATGQSDPNVHLAFNAGFALVDPKGGFYFVFTAGVPVFRKYDANGHLVFERHIEGPEVDEYLRTMPTTWHTRRTDEGNVLPVVEPAVRAAGVDREGRLWIALTRPFTYVYDSSGDKLRTVQFKGADILSPNSLFFTKDGRILVTPGCYEFRIPPL